MENLLQYKRLLEVLRLLAIDFNDQIKAFPNNVHIPDEIALAFEDVYIFTDNINSAGMIEDTQKSKLEYLNSFLDNMSINKSLWTLESLKNAKEWNIVRELSSEIINLLGEKLQKPNLDWITFIK